MLAVVDVLLIVLPTGVIALSYKKWMEMKKGAETSGRGGAIRMLSIWFKYP